MRGVSQNASRGAPLGFADDSVPVAFGCRPPAGCAPRSPFGLDGLVLNRLPSPWGLRPQTPLRPGRPRPQSPDGLVVLDVGLRVPDGLVVLDVGLRVPDGLVVPEVGLRVPGGLVVPEVDLRVPGGVVVPEVGLRVPEAGGAGSCWWCEGGGSGRRCAGWLPGCRRSVSRVIVHTRPVIVHRALPSIVSTPGSARLGGCMYGPFHDASLLARYLGHCGRRRRTHAHA